MVVAVETAEDELPETAVLVFEDVHWADNATLDLVKYLGRRMPVLRALLVLSYRSDEVGPDLRRLKRLVAPRAGDALWRHAAEALMAEGTLVRTGTWLHLPAHAARLSEAEERLAQKLLPMLADGVFDPPLDEGRNVSRESQFQKAQQGIGPRLPLARITALVDPHFHDHRLAVRAANRGRHLRCDAAITR